MWALTIWCLHGDDADRQLRVGGVVEEVLAGAVELQPHLERRSLWAVDPRPGEDRGALLADSWQEEKTRAVRWRVAH